MSPTEIEQIVAEVVRRLKTAVASAPASTAHSSSNGAPQADDELKRPTVSFATTGGTSGLPLTIAKTKRRPDAPREGRDPNSGDVFQSDDRLLTLATLEGKLDGLRRLVVHRKAIVTPSLKEELSRRGIELDRGGVKGTKRAEVAVSVVRFDAERAPSLHGLGLVEDVAAKSPAALAKLVAGQLAHADRLVVVLTKQTMAALCVLNRSGTVRAALATNVDSVRIAVRAVAANVLVVDPGHLGRVQLTALLRAFENEGVRSVPSELKEVL
jgi:hypothetical protein